MKSDTEISPASRGMFVFKEQEGPDGGPGRTIGFTDVEIQPRGYADLIAASPDRPLTIALEMRNGRILDTDIAGADIGTVARFSTTLKSHFTSRAIGLVRGGWLPPALAATKAGATILLDRNVVTEIVSRFEGGQKKGRDPDFLDLFENDAIRINPLLCALEGNSRSIPDPDQARAQLDEATRKITRALPKAEIVVGAKSLQGVLGLIEDSRSRFQRKQSMLAELAPMLCAPTGRKNVAARIASIVDAADRFGVPRKSLLVLALISSIAVPNGRSPAFTLLNLRPGYTVEDAYNALSDLRSLEILMYLYAMFPDEPIQLCTADRDLALLWCGIQASNFHLNGRGAAFDMAPNDALLPDGALELWHAAVMRVNTPNGPLG